MIIDINPSGEYGFIIQVELDKRTYSLTFQFNSRVQSWFMDIATELNEPIVSGLRLVADFPINLYHTDSRLPAGLFYVNDTSGTGESPGLQELGLDKRCQLMFFTNAELGR